jgi:hypothetical protein
MAGLEESPFNASEEMVASMVKKRHPVIDGISSYHDLLSKAQRELARLREHPERPDSDDHAQNCAAAINEAVDWLYDRELKGRADWGHPQKRDILAWLNERSPNFGRILSYNVARKHPRLKPDHDLQIYEASHSLVPQTEYKFPEIRHKEVSAKPDANTPEVVNKLGELGAVTALKLKSDTANVRFADAAMEVLSVLERLDPKKGSDQ